MDHQDRTIEELSAGSQDFTVTIFKIFQSSNHPPDRHKIYKVFQVTGKPSYGCIKQ